MDQRSSPQARRQTMPTLVTIDVHGSSAVASLAAAMDALEAACTEGQTFGALIDARSATGDSTTSPARSAQLRRLRRLRARMRERCVGVAFVVASHDEVSGQRKRLRAARLLLGTSVDTFSSVAEAKAWLGDRGVRPGPSGQDEVER